jgi:hypothetical protein
MDDIDEPLAFVKLFATLKTTEAEERLLRVVHR